MDASVGAGRAAPSGSRYSDQRPYAVVDHLDDLNGPTNGQVTLEATTVDELAQWLDGPTLVQLWAKLVLPPRVRHLWESMHPVLAGAPRAVA